jgi:hypothetical protein
MYAHHVIKVSRKYKDKLKYYYQVIQVNKLKAYRERPFHIVKAFKEAFITAHKEYYKGGEDKMGDDVAQSKELLNLIYMQFTNKSG